MIKKLFLILFNLPFLLFSQVENGNYQADSYEIRKWNNATQKYVLDAEEDYAVLLEFQDDYLIINYDENTPYFFSWEYDSYDDEDNFDKYFGTDKSGGSMKYVISYEYNQLWIYSDYNELRSRYNSIFAFKDIYKTEDTSTNSSDDNIGNSISKFMPSGRKSPPSYNDNESGNNSNSSSYEWLGNGSGIILTSDGYIATNYHVIEDVNFIEVEFKNQGEIKRYNAEVVKTDPVNDLAIIKINDDSFKKIGYIKYNFKTRKSDIGESVFALGFPKSQIMGSDIKFTDGKISSLTGAMGDVTNYQTTTPIQPGNSGGPLFDSNGNLIGINSSKLVAEDIVNVSYSIKTIYLLPLIDALPEKIDLPNSNFLQVKSFPQQFKVLENYVTLIRVR